MQAKALEQLMANEIFHAPVHQPKRLLDVGCGTGRATIQLAERFPDAQIIGVDLSPVPAIHSKPKNVQYIKGDVRSLIKNGTEPFASGSFDYIHSRLLSLGMTDWEGYLGQIRSILAPGGWLEIQEMEVDCLDANGRTISNDVHELRVFQDLLRNYLCDEIPYSLRRSDELAGCKGLEPSIASKAGDMMRNCGFVDVKETPYKVPYKEDPDNPRTAVL